MINRYTNELIKEIWEEKNKYKIWLSLELSHLLTLSSIKQATINSEIKTLNINEEEIIKLVNDLQEINFNDNQINDIKKIEKSTNHDFISFIEYIENYTQNDSARWIHFGLTSSDIIDSTNIILMRKTLITTKKYLINLYNSLNRKIKQENLDKLEILARTHGQPAEIQKVSNIFERWSSFCLRTIERLEIIIEKSLSHAKMSGPVGNNKINPAFSEAMTLSKYNLQPFENASQIIPRDIYLDYYYSLLNVCLLYEKIASDIRYYSQKEISEICEGFTKTQKGSSAMPHKRNPISCENLCGLARIAGGYFNIAINNTNTQLERDISHSSSERIILEDFGHLACFGLERTANVIENLFINKDNCIYNINKYKDSLKSQDILADKINSGFKRKESYEISKRMTNV